MHTTIHKWNKTVAPQPVGLQYYLLEDQLEWSSANKNYTGVGS